MERVAFERGFKFTKEPVCQMWRWGPAECGPGCKSNGKGQIVQAWQVSLWALPSPLRWGAQVWAEIMGCSTIYLMSYKNRPLLFNHKSTVEIHFLIILHAFRKGESQNTLDFFSETQTIKSTSGPNLDIYGLQLGNQWKAITRNKARRRHPWSVARLGAWEHGSRSCGLQTGKEAVTYFLGWECQPLHNLTAFILRVYRTPCILLHTHAHSGKEPLTSQGGVVHETTAVYRAILHANPCGKTMSECFLL